MQEEEKTDKVVRIRPYYVMHGYTLHHPKFGIQIDKPDPGVNFNYSLIAFMFVSIIINVS